MVTVSVWAMTRDASDGGAQDGDGVPSGFAGNGGGAITVTEGVGASEASKVGE